jgi:hypothetical protein
MMPLPWSFSSLEDFVNCPRAFHAKRILKSVKEEKTEAIIWGERVHKHFDLRQHDGIALPSELAMHEPYMQALQKLAGTHMNTELRIALDNTLQPCAFFDDKVWFRGVIDWIKRGDRMAFIRDYKTGKPHNKFKQLKLFALHTFATYPAIEAVDVRFYWTQTLTETGELYHRHQIADLWKEFVPDLKQYSMAFKTDTWQPRQSGLCNGWCPVKECEHWKPKRAR